jgi:hypothetical protein
MNLFDEDNCATMHSEISAGAGIKCSSATPNRSGTAMGKHYEQLTAEEREAIMMKANNCWARKIALTLHRAPSTITREPKHFGA